MLYEAAKQEREEPDAEVEHHQDLQMSNGSLLRLPSNLIPEDPKLSECPV